MTFRLVFLRYQSTRVRFAPSPTGYMHIGGLRTALFNWLLARASKGKFIVRIEDTDKNRSKWEYSENIKSSLDWAGILPDESPWHRGDYGPYTQSERLDHYKYFAKKLLASGQAYECSCTPRRLRAMQKAGNLMGYDNRCRDLSRRHLNAIKKAGGHTSIRLRIDERPAPFNDLVYGKVDGNLSGGDPILMKPDGFPVYHFANVVDDHLMDITHVLRGQEWLTSTAKHLEIYRALGFKPPQFAHLPLLLKEDGTKFSKRVCDEMVFMYKRKGYYPLPLLNFLLTTGTNIHNSEEILNLDDIASGFSLDGICTNSGQINTGKLDLLNRIYLQMKYRENPDELLKHLKNIILQNVSISDSQLSKLLSTRIHSVSTLSQLVNSSETRFMFVWNKPQPDSLLRISNNAKNIISTCKDLLSSIKSFSVDSIAQTLNSSHIGDSYADTMKVLRSCLSNESSGPTVPEMIHMLGVDECFRRLDSVFEN